MIEVSRPTCSFQNERVSFESYIDEFTKACIKNSCKTKNY